MSWSANKKDWYRYEVRLTYLEHGGRQWTWGATHSSCSDGIESPSNVAFPQKNLGRFL